MPSFLTVREAAQLTGKSTSSIRRTIIYPIIRDDKHADRQHIQPSVEEATALRMKAESFPWKIDREFLLRTVPANTGQERSSNGASTRNQSGYGSDLLSMLRAELEIKNQQITVQNQLMAKQMEVIQELSVRIKEGNILMGSLHQRLALPKPHDAKSVDPVKTKTVPSTKTEKGTAAAPKVSKQKKGFLARIFS